MTSEEARELILRKVKPMKRKDVDENIFKELDKYPDEVKEEFFNDYLDHYDVEHPSIFATEINDIISFNNTQIGLLFQDLLKITSDKIGMGEVLLCLCMKDAISGGTDDTDLILPDKKKYEVKKVSDGGIFTFSERFTEYNDLGLILNLAIMNFGHLGIFEGKNLYTTKTSEVRTFRMLLEKFLLPGENGIPFYKDQNVVKVNGELRKIVNGFLIHDLDDDPTLAAYHAMFNFRDQVLLSKIKPISMDLFETGCGEVGCTKETINNLFSITALQQILKDVEGVFLVLPNLGISYFTPHNLSESLYDPTQMHLYSISRNKMNFKGPFLKNTRAEKTPGELPRDFQSL